MKFTKRTSLLLLASILMIGMMVFGDRKALVATAAPPATSVMIVDRGLPTANLNDTALTYRSNVSWGEQDLSLNTFDGDTFTVPGKGTVRVDTIRLWFVGYDANNNASLIDDSFLGNQSFGNLSLYVGAVGSSLNRVSQAMFLTSDSDATNNPNVVATRVQYNGGAGPELDYGNNGPAGAYLTIVQLDFNNLNLSFKSGTQVQFGMRTDGDYTLSHASNAALSGSTQDQADGLYSMFSVDPNPATATFVKTVDSSLIGWDKSSDINVQVFAKKDKGR